MTATLRKPATARERMARLSARLETLTAQRDHLWGTMQVAAAREADAAWLAVFQEWEAAAKEAEAARGR
jgi:hypothetical protein